jgi:uncharacterized protein (TIGR02145 family)
MRDLKFLPFVLMLCSTLIISCTKIKDNATLPAADFSASVTNIKTDSVTSFTDLSTGNPTSWSWSFAGGTPSSSTLQNPVNIQYHAAGTYNVTLTVTNADGSNTKTKTGYIVVIGVAPQLPMVSTVTISSIANTTAVSGGTVSSIDNSVVTARGVCWSTNNNPTIANDKTTDGSSAGNFTSNLTGLNSNTTYYVRAYATNSIGTAYGNEISFTTTGLANCGTVTDVDGNVYHTVTIGTQCWMVENLKTTHYRNGAEILTAPDSQTWDAFTKGAYCYYNNDSKNNNPYGKLYNWYAVNNSDNIAPAGWHVPTKDEWITLITFLNGKYSAGGPLKDLLYWSTPNVGATNSSGFSALPGGYRFAHGNFDNLSLIGYYWASTEDSGVSGGVAGDEIHLYHSYIEVDISSGFKYNGYSVRCVKD